jgi:hypothetical protein
VRKKAHAPFVDVHVDGGTQKTKFTKTTRLVFLAKHVRGKDYKSSVMMGKHPRLKESQEHQRYRNTHQSSKDRKHNPVQKARCDAQWADAVKQPSSPAIILPQLRASPLVSARHQPSASQPARIKQPQSKHPSLPHTCTFADADGILDPYYHHPTPFHRIDDSTMMMQVAGLAGWLPGSGVRHA